MSVLINVNNTVKTLTNALINVDGVNKQVSQIWTNVNGVAKLVWENWIYITSAISFSCTQGSSGWDHYDTGYAYYSFPKVTKNFTYNVSFTLYDGSSADCYLQALVNGNWITINSCNIGYAGGGNTKYNSFSGSYDNVEVTQVRLAVGAAIYGGNASATCTITNRYQKGN